MKYLPMILCAAAMLVGVGMMLQWGLEPPVWLAGIEAALLSGAALVYGYTAYLPRLPGWMLSGPMRGTVIVVLGICAMYVPPQLVLSAFLVGTGVRMLWKSACELCNEPPERGRPFVTMRDADGSRRLRDMAGAVPARRESDG